MAEWSFLTNHARALLFIARDPDARLRDIAAALGVTERTAYGIVADLSTAGYVIKERDGRRNRYQVRQDLPIHDAVARERTVGEMLDLLVDRRRPSTDGATAAYEGVERRRMPASPPSSAAGGGDQPSGPNRDSTSAK